MIYLLDNFVVNHKMNSKKAQGMSINVIIIAAIALIVLVVLFAIFTGRMGLFGKGVKGAAGCDSGCKALNYLGGSTLQKGNTCPSPTNSLPGYVGESEDSAVCCCYNTP